MNVAYKESYIAYRKKYDKVFKAENLYEEKTVSLVDGYTVHSRTYHLLEENANYWTSESELLDCTGNILYSWRNIDEDCEFYKIIRHTNGKRYLLFRIDLYGYGVYEIESGKDFLYVPFFYDDEEHEFHETFIWTDVYYDEKYSFLSVFGCYWACPYSAILLDFSDPMREISFEEWYDFFEDHDYEEVKWENGVLYTLKGDKLFTYDDVKDKIEIRKTYARLVKRLYTHADEKYRDFNKKLLKNDNINVLGVRVPVLRKLAKEYKCKLETLMSFPDEYFEITFLKCAAAGMLPYDEFTKYVDRLVLLLDNWATCDCFVASCIKKHREEFLPYIEKYLASGREFVVRYGLVTLLHYYVEEKYLPLIFAHLRTCDCGHYYVMMAAAWLLAEVLVKHYDTGVSFLKEGCIPAQMNNKAIQKARESFRLTPAQKEELLQYKNAKKG